MIFINIYNAHNDKEKDKCKYDKGIYFKYKQKNKVKIVKEINTKTKFNAI